MIMHYKLIALDLDGTLCDDRQDSNPQNGCCFEKSSGQGVRVVLASARPLMVCS